MYIGTSCHTPRLVPSPRPLRTPPPHTHTTTSGVDALVMAGLVSWTEIYVQPSTSVTSDSVCSLSFESILCLEGKRDL